MAYFRMEVSIEIGIQAFHALYQNTKADALCDLESVKNNMLKIKLSLANNILL